MCQIAINLAGNLPLPQDARGLHHLGDDQALLPARNRWGLQSRLSRADDFGKLLLDEQLMDVGKGFLFPARVDAYDQIAGEGRRSVGVLSDQNQAIRFPFDQDPSQLERPPRLPTLQARFPRFNPLNSTLRPQFIQRLPIQLRHG